MCENFSLCCHKLLRPSCAAAGHAFLSAVRFLWAGNRLADKPSATKHRNTRNDCMMFANSWSGVPALIGLIVALCMQLAHPACHRASLTGMSRSATSRYVTHAHPWIGQELSIYCSLQTVLQSKRGPISAEHMHTVINMHICDERQYLWDTVLAVSMFEH